MTVVSLHSHLIHAHDDTPVDASPRCFLTRFTTFPLVSPRRKSYYFHRAGLPNGCIYSERIYRRVKKVECAPESCIRYNGKVGLIPFGVIEKRNFTSYMCVVTLCFNDFTLWGPTTAILPILSKFLMEINAQIQLIMTDDRRVD